MRILIAVKRSKWERDIFHYGTSEAVKQIYELQNHAQDRVFQSHERQLNARRKLKEALPDAKQVFREDLPQTDFSKYDIVASLGGDNHFVYVTRYISDRPVAGINSDIQTSSGVLLSFNTETFIKEIANSRTSDLQISQWGTIECEMIYPGREKFSTGRAISEISIRNNFADHMSRYIINKEGMDQEEQKCSGLLIATGAGSTGWFYNAVPEHLKENCIFPKDTEFFRYIARECSVDTYKYGYGNVHTGEVLELISEMDGRITVDSDERRCFDFPPGCRARFYRSTQPLNVITGISNKA